jgi:hypothetical protein
MGIRAAYDYPIDRLFRAGGDIAVFHSSRMLVMAAALVCAISFGIDQTASAEAVNRSAVPAPFAADHKTAQIMIPAYLNTGLDSKKRNVGDQVEAKTAAPVHLTDGTLIPRGAKVIGHITEAKARSKGDSESSLSVVFDSLTVPGGRSVNIKAYLRAVAPDSNSGESDGGVGYGDLKQGVAHSQPGDQSQPVPLLDEQSTGVHGIKNLTLGTDGVLRSEGKTVKLDHGSQIMLRAEEVTP